MHSLTLRVLRVFTSKLKYLRMIKQEEQQQQMTKEERAQLQQLIRDLVQGDTNLNFGTAVEEDSFDRIPYIVKNVIQSDRQYKFKEYLTHFISRKEREIEQMCGLYYKDFVDSVEQLLKVREESSSLKDKVKVMNLNIAAVGQKYFEKKTELVAQQQKLLNFEKTIEVVQSCLFVLDITNKISIQISNKKYFSALRV